MGAPGHHVNYFLQFNESSLQLRTREAYTAHVADLNGPIQDHISTTYGITGNSILNKSRYFHVVDGLVPDIMHDILEGAIQLTLKWLIHHLIYDEKIFSLAILNKRISSFQYGYAELKNKPSEYLMLHFKCQILSGMGCVFAKA